MKGGVKSKNKKRQEKHELFCVMVFPSFYHSASKQTANSLAMTRHDQKQQRQ